MATIGIRHEHDVLAACLQSHVQPQKTSLQASFPTQPLALCASSCNTVYKLRYENLINPVDASDNASTAH